MVPTLLPIPRASGRGCAVIRRLLNEAGYGEAQVADRLGLPDPDLGANEQAALWAWRARGTDALSLAIRLFLLERAVGETAARRGLGAASTDALLALGLVRRQGARLEPTAQLSLHADRIIAGDRTPATRSRADADLALGPTNATRLLDRCTLRAPVRRALDLGTGTGYLALRLSDHATEVVGTDVSARALAFARFNAGLARAARVRFVRSDRFEALGRQRFDLITGNLPFVISPDRRYVYRDAGLPADDFLGSVVSAAGVHLVEGGRAQFLGQWVCDGDHATEEERLATWTAAAGCDALVWRFQVEPVDRYAARWVAGPTETSAPERERRMARWLAHYHSAGIRSIATGLLTLRRRKAPRHFLQIEDVPVPDRPCADDLARRFQELEQAAHPGRRASRAGPGRPRRSDRP